MSTKDFLIELGTEELPPKALNSLDEALLSGIEKGLKAAGPNYAVVRFYAAPRRLAVLVEQLAMQQPDCTVNLDGPPLQAAFDASGSPTQAALGFARKYGVDLQHIGKSDPKLRLSQTIAGQPAVGLLPGIVEVSLNELPIPKRVHRVAHREEFTRPTQWLVMLFSDDVVECEILVQKAGREPHGHRFHNPDNVHISGPITYLEDLRGTHVLVDFAERRELIAKRVAKLAAEQQGSTIASPSLFDKVTTLVEWPVSLICPFEERFLEVPQEALITTMQDNQKYFYLLDANDKPLPCFITIANVESKAPENVVSGNEKVVHPRLTDAEFFFKQGRRQLPESFNKRLRNIVFQAQPGTVFEKTQHVSDLAAYTAGRVGDNVQNVMHTDILSKYDLATEMVGEFPGTQGITGYYCVTHGGGAENVALALNEQYMPRGTSVELPSTLVGAIVAVTDKLDTLAGALDIGMLPAGSRDPYALRRAVLGVLRILVEEQLGLDLVAAADAAVEQYGNKVKAASLARQVLDFVFDRLHTHYEDEGVDVTVYQSVCALRPSSPLDSDQRVQIVQAFCQLPEAKALTAANKRVSNVLVKSEDEAPPNVGASLLVEATEKALGSAVANAKSEVAPLAAARDHRAMLARLAALREPMNTFFADMMTNVDNAAVRASRHALLAKLRGSFLGVADISLLG